MAILFVGPSNGAGLEEMRSIPNRRPLLKHVQDGRIPPADTGE